MKRKIIDSSKPRKIPTLTPRRPPIPKFWKKMVEENKGFVFMPAAIVPAKFRCFLWIKKRKTGVKFHVRHIPDKEKSHYTTIYYFPDRIIHIETGSNIPIGPRWKDNNNATFLNLDIFNKECYVQKECLPTALGSYYYWDLDRNIINDKHWKFDNPNLLMTLDSGGAQLRFDTAEKIDLHNLGRQYALYAHRGMSLDIPPMWPDFKNDNAMKVLALAQKTNSKVIRKYTKHIPDFEYLSVIQGVTKEMQFRWLDRTNEDHTTAYAIGVRSYENILDNLPIIAEIIFNRKKSVHILGVNSFTFFPFLCLIGRYGLVVSDGSTYINHTFKARRYLSFDVKGKSNETMMVGNPSFDYLPYGTGRIAPCQCPICLAMPYIEMYKAPEMYRPLPLLGLHNLYVYNKYIDYWNSVFRILPIKKAIKHYANTVGNRNRKKPEWFTTIMLQVEEYMNTAQKHGVDNANNLLGEMNELKKATVAKRSHFVLGFQQKQKKSLDVEIIGRLTSGVYKAQFYLTEKVLARYGYKKEFFKDYEKERVPRDIQVLVKEIKAQNLESSLRDILNSHPLISEKYQSDTLTLWKYLKPVVKKKNRKCIIDSSHKVIVENFQADGGGTLLNVKCETCGYDFFVRSNLPVKGNFR